MKLADLIRQRRAEKNISRERLARKANCSMSTIYHIEEGFEGIGFDNLTRICTALDIEVLLTFKGQKYELD